MRHTKEGISNVFELLVVLPSSLRAIDIERRGISLQMMVAGMREDLSLERIVLYRRQRRESDRDGDAWKSPLHQTVVGHDAARRCSSLAGKMGASESMSRPKVERKD